MTITMLWGIIYISFKIWSILASEVLPKPLLYNKMILITIDVVTTPEYDTTGSGHITNI